MKEFGQPYSECLSQGYQGGQSDVCFSELEPAKLAIAEADLLRGRLLAHSCVQTKRAELRAELLLLALECSDKPRPVSQLRLRSLSHRAHDHRRKRSDACVPGSMCPVWLDNAIESVLSLADLVSAPVAPLRHVEFPFLWPWIESDVPGSALNFACLTERSLGLPATTNRTKAMTSDNAEKTSRPQNMSIRVKVSESDHGGLTPEIDVSIPSTWPKRRLKAMLYSLAMDAEVLTPLAETWVTEIEVGADGRGRVYLELVQGDQAEVERGRTLLLQVVHKLALVQNRQNGPSDRPFH